LELLSPSFARASEDMGGPAAAFPASSPRRALHTRLKAQSKAARPSPTCCPSQARPSASDRIRRARPPCIVLFQALSPFPGPAPPHFGSTRRTSTLAAPLPASRKLSRPLTPS
ncbi:hypothetical protein C8T65DRAFT_626099, partial [Cerioporus squamosus]